MYEIFIKNYINNKLSKNDIINFANKENVNLTIEEVNIIYYYIKNYWEIFYKGDPTTLFKELKTKLSAKAYNKAYSLYLEYKKKI